MSDVVVWSAGMVIPITAPSILDGAVAVRVSVQVPLPIMPARLGGVGVGVSSSARAPVREVVARE